MNVYHSFYMDRIMERFWRVESTKNISNELEKKEKDEQPLHPTHSIVFWIQKIIEKGALQQRVITAIPSMIKFSWALITFEEIAEQLSEWNSIVKDNFLRTFKNMYWDWEINILLDTKWSATGFWTWIPMATDKSWKVLRNIAHININEIKNISNQWVFDFSSLLQSTVAQELWHVGKDKLTESQSEIASMEVFAWHMQFRANGITWYFYQKNLNQIDSSNTYHIDWIQWSMTPKYIEMMDDYFYSLPKNDHRNLFLNEITDFVEFIITVKKLNNWGTLSNTESIDYKISQKKFGRWGQLLPRKEVYQNIVQEYFMSNDWFSIRDRQKEFITLVNSK